MTEVERKAASLCSLCLFPLSPSNHSFALMLKLSSDARVALRGDQHEKMAKEFRVKCTSLLNKESRSYLDA